MREQDLDELSFLEETSSHNPWSKRMFSDELTHPNAYCFVAREEDPGSPSPIGFICFRIQEAESELFNLCVHSNHRRCGIARTLLEFYFDFCREKKVNTCYLEVKVDNEPALRLYHLFSYRPIGKRPNFYQGRYAALLMAKDL